LWHDGTTLSDDQPLDPSHQPSAISHDPPPLAARALAAIEVIICSDFLTQFALGGTLAALGYRPFVQGRLSVGYVVALSLLDTVLLIGLIFLMLYAHGERPRDVLIGRRPIVPETVFGVPLILAALALAVAVLVPIQRFAPSLHTVQNNPLQELLRSPRDAWLFALVVVAAGGLREEIQRAFLLHRFEVWLGGPTFGVVVTSAAFGAGHLVLQGVDAAVTTGVLGAFWGTIYLRRRSCVAPIVSHAGFDLVQILQFFAVGK
jgi:membrane protease YdiL (CAAX protease family)